MSARVIAARLAAVLVAQSDPANASGPNGLSLEGSWRTTVSIEGVEPFSSVFSFAAGGTITAIDSSQLSPPSATNGLGVWEKIGPHTYAYTFVSFLFDTASDFAPAGELKLWGVITLDGKDAYSTSDQFEFRDADGNVTFSGCAVQQAARMTVESVRSCFDARARQTTTLDHSRRTGGWRTADPGRSKRTP